MFYEDPLHACIYETWRTNEELPLVQDAIVPYLEMITTPELLAFGEYIEERYIKPERNPVVESIWPTVQRTVDDSGRVKGDFGPVSRVIDFFRDEQSSWPILEWLGEDVVQHTFFAVERWWNIIVANQHDASIRAEMDRRVEQTVREQPPAGWLEIAD
jgi:hypothetical protein